MAQATIQTLAGDTLQINEEKIEVLRHNLRGNVCLPGEAGGGLSRDKGLSYS